MSGRFRLDPRAPEPVRAPPQPQPPAPPPPARRPAPANAPERRRRWVFGAIALVALLVVAALAFTISGVLAYPNKYVLDEDEYPNGIEKARLTREEMSDLGIAANPGDVSQDRVEDNDFLASGRTQPDRVHALVLEDEDRQGRLNIFALKYTDEDDARSAAQEMRAICSFANGAVLRDGDVLVAIVPENFRTGVRPVGEALREKASGLTPVCGL